jgi:hypothetical protein
MTTNSRKKILITTHKEFVVPANDSYLPIHAGKIASNLNLNYQGDDTGDNISLKNKNFCELTAIYWAWKNLIDIDYIGICHYRRFFLFSKYFKNQLKYFSYSANELFALKGALRVDESILKKFDFILAEPISHGKSIYDDYSYFHSVQDFDILGDVIKEFDIEYFNSFKELFYNSSELSPYNMFLTSKENFNGYCEWLFPILFEVEKRIIISKDNYQSRVFGFMGERLLNLYVYHNKFKVKYLPVVKIEDGAIAYPVRIKLFKFFFKVANYLFG